MPIPVIDLFAGPGGLGEGFSSVLESGKKRTFKIKLSIEMDEFAHRTLELRAFLREFPPGQLPDEYYAYLEGRLTRAELFSRYVEAAKNAGAEAWHAELGRTDIPHELVDSRIREALGKAKDWVLIGGPPCQAYSLAGRSRVIGGAGLAAYERDARHHLYLHYLRIIAVHRPPVFVMENVKGLLSAKLQSEGTFARILKDLEWPLRSRSQPEAKSPELHYRLVPLTVSKDGSSEVVAPEDFLIRAEEYGVPQARHRVIILGVRSDMYSRHDTLTRQAPITVEQAIGDLPRLRSALSKESDSPETWHQAIQDLGSAAWVRNEGVVSAFREAIPTALKSLGRNLDRGAKFIRGATKSKCHTTWFSDPRLTGVCNHESRGHIREDLHRYLFAAVHAKNTGRSPLLENFPKQLLPDHENVVVALKENKFNDRFRVQVEGRPSTTVVSHISKDGHYFIHYDPTQCRSLTVREAARLQTFPDNYFFEGPRTEQYRQVGNAVPPYLAKQIGNIVASILR